MKYLLEDRERNGYDDSDFYAIFFDSEAGDIKTELYGSTRFPSPRTAPAEYIRELPAKIKAKAENILFDRAFSIIQREDISDVDQPENASIGESLEILSDGFFKDKKSGERIPYRAGESATVTWIGAFGQFYRNGYNHPNRENRRVGLKFSDGRLIFIALNKCKRARPYLSEEQIAQRAKGCRSFAALWYL